MLNPPGPLAHPVSLVESLARRSDSHYSKGQAFLASLLLLLLLLGAIFLLKWKAYSSQSSRHRFLSEPLASPHSKSYQSDSRSQSHPPPWRISWCFHPLSGISPSKGTEGERLIKSTAVLIASPQKDLGIGEHAPNPLSDWSLHPLCHTILLRSLWYSFL